MRGGWVWGGRGVAAAVLVGLVVYLARVGLETADKLASVMALLVAVAALVAPYLLPAREGRDGGRGWRVSRSGAATAKGGGRANTGIHVTGSAAPAGPMSVEKSGAASAEESASRATSGIEVDPSDPPGPPGREGRGT